MTHAPLFRLQFPEARGVSSSECGGDRLGANWVITDMILLRMNFDLSRFGVIKSSMFLLPALAYWAAAGLAAEAELRPSGLPLVLFCPGGSAAGMPAAALLTDDGRILFAVCLIVFSGGYTFALFANNSLLAIYKSALPAAEFNRRRGDSRGAARTRCRR